MSRSKKKPIIVCSTKVDKDIVHGQVRAKIRAELQKDEPDHQVLESTIKQFGLEDLGTVFGFDFLGGCSEEERAEYEADIRVAERK